MIVLATFLLPLLLTKKFGMEEVVSGEVVENVGENEEKSNANDYQYSSFETIKLLH